jgi:hypothetical protein
MACRVIRNDRVIHLTRLGTIGNVLATTVDLLRLGIVMLDFRDENGHSHEPAVIRKSAKG